MCDIPCRYLRKIQQLRRTYELEILSSLELHPERSVLISHPSTDFYAAAATTTTTTTTTAAAAAAAAASTTTATASVSTTVTATTTTTTTATATATTTTTTNATTTTTATTTLLLQSPSLILRKDTHYRSTTTWRNIMECL